MEPREQVSETEYEHDRYVTTPDKIRETVEKYGVAIVDNVLSTKECDAFLDGMWSTVSHLTKNMPTPVLRTDQNTWRTFGKGLLPSHGMLLQFWGIGHAQCLWDIRMNPKVIRNFETVWNNTDLLVSFDGAAFLPPPEVTNLGWDSNKSWLHTDQSYTRNNFECLQSWVTACDVNVGDATLVFLEASNKYHGRVAKEFNITDPADWYKLSAEQQEFYIDELGCDLQRVKCPKGAQVFWDSRTIHAGQGAMKGRAKQNVRCVGYMCYTPRNLATPAFLKRKQKHFADRRTMNHWPHKGKVFSKNPRIFGGEQPNINPLPPPTLTKVGMRLAGHE